MISSRLQTMLWKAFQVWSSSTANSISSRSSPRRTHFWSALTHAIAGRPFLVAGIVREQVNVVFQDVAVPVGNRTGGQAVFVLFLRADSSRIGIAALKAEAASVPRPAFASALAR